MICPVCEGKRLIDVPGMSEVFCPTCEGQGKLPDAPAVGHCLACGEPLTHGQVWCDEHKDAILFDH